MTASYLAVDTGGTNSRIRFVIEGYLERNFTVPTDSLDPRATLRALSGYLPADFEPQAVCVAVAGNVKDGVMVGSGNLPGWVGVNLHQLVQEVFGCRATVILNDCEAAALGEYDALQQECVYVIWGTGVGVAAVRNVGNMAVPMATEMGHMVIDVMPYPLCGCGGSSHLEALVGGGHLLERYGPVSRKSNEPDMDEHAWHHVLKHMARGLHNINMTFLGKPIVIGGGVMTKQAHRLGQLQELVNRHKGANQPPELLLAEYGEDSGLVGATLMARQRLELSSA